MSNLTIYKTKILVVEGKDEEKFFGALLNHMGIRDYQIIEVGGKGEFRNTLPAFVKTSGFSNVSILAIIRDADTNATRAFQSIRDILRRNDIKPSLQLPTRANVLTNGNPRIGIYIMPGNSSSGMLEDLCLQTVQNHPSIGCLDQYITCVQEIDGLPQPGIISKAKTQAFLAVKPEIAKDVGVGALKGYWNFDSDVLDGLKVFIENLR